MGEPIIELYGLCKQYGEQTAVDRLTLTVNKGEIFGLLGPNGAGKSTTILMMLGLTEPTSGSVKVCGLDSTRQPLQVKKRVGYLPDDVGFYEDRSGYENLLYTAALNRVERPVAERRARELLERVGLGEAARKKAGAYSRGMRQRLGLADVLIKQPEVVVLDEPTLGIDPEGVRELLELIRRLSRDEGITVLLSSHHLHQVQQICDRVGLFVRGQLLAEGTVEALSRQLFEGEPIGITVAAEPLTEELIALVQGIPGVLSVERDGRVLNATCESDAAAAIGRAVVEAGFSLHQLGKRELGLDEIYHRYFEGGEKREAVVQSGRRK